MAANDFANKLGIRAGHHIYLEGAPGEFAAERLTGLPPGCRVATVLPNGSRPDMVILWLKDKEGLEALFQGLDDRATAGAGQLWASGDVLGDTGTLGWIENPGTPVHTEFRDDRFTAAFERRKDDATTYSVAYIVRAVSPGSYVLPQAVVEDMYRPDRFGRTETGAVEVAPAK